MKIAFSGTQGTGKTTAMYKLAYEMKMKYPSGIVSIISEVARESPFPINTNSTEDSQWWIFNEQIRRENDYTKRTRPYDSILICDRTVMDAVAYTRYRGFDWEKMYEQAVVHMKTYDTVYFHCTEVHPYNFPDTIRSTDDLFRENIESLLLDLYSRYKDCYPNFNLRCSKDICGRVHDCFSPMERGIF